jgi:predicted porin
VALRKPAIIAAGALLACALAFCCSGVAAQPTPGFTAYGSLRVQGESVDRDRFPTYHAVRDAYSRIGIEIDTALVAGTALTGQLEIPVDVANGRLRDPYDQDAPLRLANLGLRGQFGTLTYGQQWMPYYNAIAAPVDMFSSYYSGFATYTVFRVAQAVAYQTPQVNEFSAAAGYATSAGNRLSTSRIENQRWQATASYTHDDTRLAFGIDDRGDAGYGRNRLYGLSMSQKRDNLYVALKIELFQSGNQQSGAFSRDGNRAVNVFGSYVAGETTFKLMLAKVDNYGGNILHAGIDYQLAEKRTLFAEMYREGSPAALTSRRGGLGDTGDGDGGQAVAVGLRQDF